MADCTRPGCGHPEGVHDNLGFCLADDCECRGFLHPDDAVLGEGEPYVVDDEDEMELPEEIDFDADADR